MPYDITLKHEKYYQTIFFTVFKLLGAEMEAEVRTNLGRADAVVKTTNDIYVFEFKLTGSADAALAQITSKGYTDSYRSDPRRVTAVGVAFDAGTRNLADWRVRTITAQ